MSESGISMLRKAAAIWGFVGVTSFLGFAVFRLYDNTFQAFESNLTLFQWVLLFANIVFMSYSEGYRGFQKNFSPRVAARIRYLKDSADLKSGLFAPAFCMGYFGTTRRRQISVIVLTLALMALISVVRTLPQPWRGIIDAGVVVGLTWGLISLFVMVWLAFTSNDFDHPHEVQ
ncbi:Uncharacterised protein [BD1-7 clade bacterium]|uniref:Uncharacterized protein n=1 Tax=BD1-7 clade bacterium TaxID=2029982 RepID=A0A5S9MT69_9GAMM|nr:Uncharacterised protein [BD1-7 clade bacterium]CAA0080684.1 Uncharacterised protein [BD1-7 clade bacterium]CAA0084392.1 Uncharacterised protein [BD1-7 clade bacterium]